MIDAADVVPVGGTDARVATMLPLVETALQISLDAEVVLEQKIVVMGAGRWACSPQPCCSGRELVWSSSSRAHGAATSPHVWARR